MKLYRKGKNWPQNIPGLYVEVGLVPIDWCETHNRQIEPYASQQHCRYHQSPEPCRLLDPPEYFHIPKEQDPEADGVLAQTPLEYKPIDPMYDFRMDTEPFSDDTEGVSVRDWADKQGISIEDLQADPPSVDIPEGSWHTKEGVSDDDT